MPSENVTTVQRAMSNGLQTIAKRFSAFLTVIYFLDAATLSSGKYASLHGRLSQSKRDPPSPCHLRCVSDVSKVISFEECVTSCQEKLSSHRDTMHKNRKKRDSSSIRQQRSAEYQNECMTSAVQSRNKPLPVKIRSVEFKEKDIDVVWEKKNFSKTDYNWSAYAFIYKVQCDRCIDDSVDMCKIIPKNQTDYSVPLAYWEKPEHLFAAVVTFPFSKKAHVSLQTFSPYAPARRIPMLTEAKKGDTVKLVSSIVGGIVAGVVMLLLLFALVRKRPCQGSTPRMPPPEPPRLEEKKDEKELYYTCYYPESDAFRDEVASIVNYFRQNGYNVIMDVMVSTEITSQGPTRWGESQIRKANKVLVFLSPGLINLALDGCDGFQSQDTNRVWIELEALRDLYTRNRSASKMVCITLPDMPLTSEPLPLWAKVIYKWPDDALEILKRLNDRPKILAI